MQPHCSSKSRTSSKCKEKTRRPAITTATKTCTTLNLTQPKDPSSQIPCNTSTSTPSTQRHHAQAAQDERTIGAKDLDPKAFFI